MKVRSLEELENALSREMAWRRLELSKYWLTAETSRDAAPHLLRAAAVLLLAHWEGGVRNMAQAYVNYACHTAPSMARLQPSFRAIAVKTRLTRSSEPTYGEALELVRWWHASDGRSPSDLCLEVRTGGNLTPNLLSHIFEALAIEYPTLATTREKFLNEALETRHRVAHGNLAPVTRGEFVALRLGVEQLLDTVHESIFEAARKQAFLVP